MTALAQRIPLNEERLAPRPTGEQRLLLHDVSWEAYEMIGEALRDRPAIRLTYDQGKLEIMTTSPEHEKFKVRMERLVETLAEEFERAIDPVGSATFKRKLKALGLEADLSFWITHEALMRTRLDWDPASDPPPDLFVEIEITRSFLARLELCATLGVPEVWRCDGESLRVLLLQPDKTYRESSESPTFPGIPLDGIVRFLQPNEAMDYLSMVRAFRTWVQEQRKKSSESAKKQPSAEASTTARPRKKRGKN